VYLKEAPARDKSIPGPGTYYPPGAMGREGPMYTLHPRIKDNRKQVLISKEQER
jgi:hypothetical protein